MDEETKNRLDSLRGQITAFEMLVPIAIIGSIGNKRTQKQVVSTLKTIESSIVEQFQKELPHVVKGQVETLKSVREVLMTSWEID